MNVALLSAGYMADLNGSLPDDVSQFEWDFETSLNGNFSCIISCILFSLSSYCLNSAALFHAPFQTLFKGAFPMMGTNYLLCSYNYFLTTALKK